MASKGQWTIRASLLKHFVYGQGLLRMVDRSLHVCLVMGDRHLFIYCFPGFPYTRKQMMVNTVVGGSGSNAVYCSPLPSPHGY